MPSQSGRDRLLDAVVGYFAADGLGDQSLRAIAEAVGTSHRMLLYHFGSRDGLLLAVAQAVEARTQLQMSAFAANGDAWGSAEMIRQVWAYVSDPDLGDFERLFFALYSRALQGDDALAPLLAGDVSRWLDFNVAAAGAVGIDLDPAVVAVHARLGLAVVRGLLLDLLATGERAEVSAALDVFAGLYAGAGFARSGG